MFNDLVITVLDQCGWRKTATYMKISEVKLKEKVRNNNLSLEDCCDIIISSSSPELLRYMMQRMGMLTKPGKPTLN